MAVGYKRVSLATLRKILGLEDISDNSGRVVQEAPLEAWANLKQRSLDHALKEINKHSDIQLELEFIGRGSLFSAETASVASSLADKAGGG